MHEEKSTYYLTAVKEVSHSSVAMYVHEADGTCTAQKSSKKRPFESNSSQAFASVPLPSSPFMCHSPCSAVELLTKF